MKRATDSSVQAVLQTLHSVLDPVGDLYYDWAVVSLAKLSPTVAALPAALNDATVWPDSQRHAVLSTLPQLERVNGRFGVVNVGNLKTKSGRSFALLLSESHAFAEDEGAPGLREWHLVKSN